MRTMKTLAIINIALLVLFIGIVILLYNKPTVIEPSEVYPHNEYELPLQCADCHWYEVSFIDENPVWMLGIPKKYTTKNDSLIEYFTNSKYCKRELSEIWLDKLYNRGK